MEKDSRVLRLKAILLICLGAILIFFAMVSTVSFFTFKEFYKKAAVLTVPEKIYGAAQTKPRAPLIDPKVRAELKAARQREKNRLMAYGWVDRSRGIIHIPIDRAIDLVLKDNEFAKKSETKELQ